MRSQLEERLLQTEAQLKVASAQAVQVVTLEAKYKELSTTSHASLTQYAEDNDVLMAEVRRLKMEAEKARNDGMAQVTSWNGHVTVMQCSWNGHVTFM